MLNVIGIGELLWDLLPEGKKLGGAPCNFVYHANKLGASARILSAVGSDEMGREILETIKRKNLSTDLIQINDSPTGTVDVKLNSIGVPKYFIHQNVAWDFLYFDENAIGMVNNADIVCFGSLAQRNAKSREIICQFLNVCKTDALVIFDINIRQTFYSKEIIENSLHFCNVLKMNEEEYPIVCNLIDLKGDDLDSNVRELITKYDLKLLAFTRGTQGSILYTPTEKSEMTTPKIDVKDTVGAGDSFAAAMAIGFANKLPLRNLHEKAIEIASFVCESNGAMPYY